MSKKEAFVDEEIPEIDPSENDHHNSIRHDQRNHKYQELAQTMQTPMQKGQ